MAVEFALLLPILLIVAAVLIELGRGLAQSEAVSKGLRGAAMFAARSDLPLDGTTQTKITNLARTGTVDGSGGVMTPGWSEAGAGLAISTYSTTIDGELVWVIRLVATVPYDEVLPGVLDFVGLGGFTVTSSHEQVHIGNLN